MGWGELAACLYKTTILVLFSKRVSTSMILTNVLYYTRIMGGGGWGVGGSQICPHVLY